MHTVSLFEDGMCNFSSGPCALLPGPEVPVQRNMASGYFPCIIAMNGIVPPVQVTNGGSPVSSIEASWIASETVPSRGPTKGPHNGVFRQAHAEHVGHSETAAAARAHTVCAGGAVSI